MFFIRFRELTKRAPGGMKNSFHRDALEQLLVPVESTEPKGAGAFARRQAPRLRCGDEQGCQLYLRRMDELEATPIPGTEGGGGPLFLVRRAMGRILGGGQTEESPHRGRPSPGGL